MRFVKIPVIVVLTVLAWCVPATAIGQGFKIVANQANTIETISEKQLEDIFLKKVGTWSNGQHALPVDQAAGSSTRSGFSKVIFGRDVSAIKSYWQRQIFSGRSVPPPEKASDDEVLAFVRANPGAVGYVASDADIGSGVKVLEISK